MVVVCMSQSSMLSPIGLLLILVMHAGWATTHGGAAPLRRHDAAAPCLGGPTCQRFSQRVPSALPTLAAAVHALEGFGNAVQLVQASTRPAPCLIQIFGARYGDHALCDRRAVASTPHDCVFYSFGINDDYSFDVQLADAWQCAGVGLDPSITHPSMLHPNVSFYQVAARTLDARMPQWHMVTTVPGLRSWLRHSYISVLKMDCEGCEYSVARDVLLEDPNFWSRVDQFAVEVHLARTWIKSDDHILHLGALILQLGYAGLELVHASVGGCAEADEAMGCHPLLPQSMTCGPGRMCQNYLFARRHS